MKKLLLLLIVILVLGTIAIYIFIPQKITVSHAETLNVNDRWAFKYISDISAWKKWMPQGSSDSTLTFNGQVFSIDSLYYNAVLVNIERNGNSSKSRIYILPVNNYEVHIAWASVIEAGMNPLSRLKQYQNAVLLKQNMVSLLGAYKQWLMKPENIYGFTVVPGKIVDTMLITKMARFKGNYPTPLQIDSLLNMLRQQAANNGAKADGYPMMHVVSNERGIYDAQVALPINKKIPETRDLKIKYMFSGNVLVTRFKGGPYTIEKAYQACEDYKNDNQRITVALPFQSIITDRVKEPDTTKWETVVNFPVQ
jgi:effector-binding domain-containing protein